MQLLAWRGNLIVVHWTRSQVTRSQVWLPAGHCQVTTLGKLFTHMCFTCVVKQYNLVHA